MDFIGVQNYTRELVSASWLRPLIWAKIVKAEKRNVETTVMNWEVYPECIYNMLVKFSEYKNFKDIIVTENGAAFHDYVHEGKVKDHKRKAYLQQHVQNVLRAIKVGVNVKGYFIWSFTDNFEWAEGFNTRFGLVYIDFATQKRIIKDSGYWFSRFIQNNKAVRQYQ